jgi:subtilase family serine protease
VAGGSIVIKGRTTLVRFAAALLAVLGTSLAVLALRRAAGADRAAPRSPAPRLLGPTRGASVVDFSLVLRLPGQRRLSRFLEQLYDPRSRAFHHFIDAKLFGDRFGISRPVLHTAVRALTAEGVQVTAEYPQRTAIDARAPAAVVERLFGVRLMDYLGPGGRRFHAPTGQPSIPALLSRAVSAVGGLDGRFVPTADDVPAGGLAPSEASIAYDVTPLHELGIEGQGEKLAIISFGTYQPSSLVAFDRQFGLPLQEPAQQGLGSGATDSSADAQGEVELDLDIAHEIAPRAQLIDYNAGFLDSSGVETLGSVIDRIVADGKADIVSDSYGVCELAEDTADLQRGERAIEAAEAHGITIFKSTGDAGAYECQRLKASDHRLSVEWPASSPGVVAVGGTSLSVGVDGAYAGETAWQDTLSQQGGGGGLSAIYQRPPWQRAPGVENGYSNGSREVPDVSANADTASGWSVYQGGQLTQVGGTSAASPFWAAAMLLIEQYAQRHGIRRLGFVDPTLYAIASSPQPFTPFHDITVGANRFYPATAGWDFATGLGSPDVYNLARDVVAYLEAHHASG